MESPAPNAPATVSDSRLDKYEVTVGRFRRYMEAIVKGWRPANGDGKHTHLNGGRGLVNAATGDFETGWNTEWVKSYQSNLDTWSGSLYYCGAAWSESPGEHENRPILCQGCESAYSFCIWDGGFLPTEAEWNYAAAGGDEQRRYPWGDATPAYPLATYGCGVTISLPLSPWAALPPVMVAGATPTWPATCSSTFSTRTTRASCRHVSIVCSSRRRPNSTSFEAAMRIRARASSRRPIEPAITGRVYKASAARVPPDPHGHRALAAPTLSDSSSLLSDQ